MQHKAITAHQPRHSHAYGPNPAFVALVRFTIIEKFLDRVDKKKEQLATDQLLSAIFLLTRDGTPSDELEREKLRDVILKPLNK